MAKTYEIPLSPNAQTFSITLQNVVYYCTVVWNAQNGTWVLDIADGNQNPLVQGIPLVTGCDLLAQYGYLGFGGVLTVQTDFDADALPTVDNLGDNSHLYFITP